MTAGLALLALLLIAAAAVATLVWMVVSIGGSRQRPSAAARPAPDPPSARPGGKPLEMEIDFDFSSLEIVGESHYQQTLEDLAGGRTEDGADVDVEATLRPEPTNQHDPNAVRVEISGERVGYLSRASTKRYHAVFTGLTITVPARIVGGWDRGGGDRGSFGVKLDSQEEFDDE